MSTDWTCDCLNDPAYLWLRKAIERLETLGKSPSGDVELQAVCEADTLHNSAGMRIVMQAALLANDATVEAAAAALGLSRLVVEAFSDLLFNVIDRKDEPAYLMKAVEAALTPPGLLYDARNVDMNAKRLLLAGLNGTVAEVMALARKNGHELLN
jgi:hypothetical protein